MTSSQTMTQTQTDPVGQLASLYAELRAKREAMEAEAKKIAEVEAQVKARLVTEMGARQMTNARFAGVGAFRLRDAVRYEITDIELMARAMLQRMVDNGKNGRPLSDGLMLQKRTAKTVIEELITSGDILVADLADMGLMQNTQKDLTFTREKEKQGE